MNLLYQNSCPFLHSLQVVPMLQRCPSLQVREPGVFAMCNTQGWGHLSQATRTGGLFMI